MDNRRKRQIPKPGDLSVVYVMQTKVNVWLQKSSGPEVKSKKGRDGLVQLNSRGLKFKEK